METINNAVTTASKIIWGEGNPAESNETAGTEPISGQTGKGTVNEPYDQGNSTNPISTSTHPSSNTITKTNDTTTPNTTTLPDRTTDKMTSHTHTEGSDPTGPHDSHLGNKADPRVDSDHVGSYGNTTGASNTETTPSSNPTNLHNAAAGGPPEPHQETDKTGVIGGHGDPLKTSDNVASESSSNPGVVPSSGAGISHKQQGADRPNDEPTGEQKGAVKESKEDAEDFLKTKDPNDHSGEPMHMHTGAGDGSTVPKTQAERRESTIGNPGGQEHGKETSEGTGEQWVKTSGMSADGGDFDATKPGAGREADSLMEQKGIHKTEPGKPSEPLPESSGHGHGQAEKEKVPLGEKIKAKLHIGHKDK
ncbi:hypothetical protein K505DRAFT_267920 [Melanomma pulvis-pyrius CBS 109.77]|uniref:Uncharacterized protein n=1 Tax=Melanomma pulvis-pyrius CBS 109.77 TaxID=1314802 RepID=A0A6A6XPV1_9PLEO|nr:hypothetical protein K505DRAFT_267920 [Melanomma pulvis-pyrius CBS 109.77]